MTDKKIIAALAKLNSDIYEMDDINHDSLQFIIDSLEWDTFVLYKEELWGLMADGVTWFTRHCYTYRAKVGEKTEAILRAVGKWEDN